MIQTDNAGILAEKSLASYDNISKATEVRMHSHKSASERINLLKESKDKFISLSRKLAGEAQQRESVTLQPKEMISAGEKAKITISNYLGGYYYFTADEARIDGNGNLVITEAKHSANGSIPSIDDIKEGLIKMILFSNLENITVKNKKYNIIPTLKLTSNNSDNLSLNKKNIIKTLRDEAQLNGFKVKLDCRGL